MTETHDAGGTLLVGFVLFPGYTALDLIGPHEVLVRSRSRCILIARTRESVTSNNGIRISPDMTFRDCPELDVLVVPGGPGQEHAMNDEELIAFIAHQTAGVTWIASVCTGALLLARTGVLTGRRATTHWLAMEELARFGAVPVRERVVWDGRIVTAAGVSAGIDLALSLTAAMYGPTEAQRIQLAIEYDPAPPFDAGAPEKAPNELVQQLRGSSRFALKPA
jgi:cyclohexyl-isocyanide hydratase